MRAQHYSPNCYELHDIHVENNVDEVRGQCWFSDFSLQFPVKSIKQDGNHATIYVDEPHLGYTIDTFISDDKINGNATMMSEKQIVIAKLNFVNGIADGPCTLYDEFGQLFYEGYLKNGFRQGKGLQYDSEGNVVLHGLFDMGKKLNLVQMEEMPGYWKEIDSTGQLISVTKRDEFGRKNDICFFYNDKGEITRISKWKEGKEIAVSGRFLLYDIPKGLWLEGYYKDGFLQGRGKEYDSNGNIMFDGYYNKGICLNLIKMNKMDGYWKEYDKEGKLLSISKRDEMGFMNGICYVYNSDGEISRISEYIKGKEKQLFKLFKNDTMTEYYRGSKIYEGEYINSILFNYPRNGYGKEYNTVTKNVIYEGYFFNGKRNGIGKSFNHQEIIYDGMWIDGKTKFGYYFYKILATVIGAVIICISGFLDSFLAVILILFYIVGVYHIWKPSIKECECKVSQSKDLDCLSLMISSLTVLPNCCKNIKRLDLSNYKWLRTIEIGENCLELVKTVIIDGLLKLQSIKINNNDSSQERKSSGKKNRSFRISNCTKLEIIEIGEHNFCNIGGEVEFNYLPSLQWLNIGNYCFGGVTSFKINRLQKLKKLMIHHNSFCSDHCVGIEYKALQIMNCEQLESIEIGNNSFSDFAGNVELKNLLLLYSMNIGNNSFGSVEIFRIGDLNQLRSIKIGNNSFTQKSNISRINKSKSFHITNCNLLESIEIGEYSFSDFAGNFELKNLDSLRSISIGSTKSYSANFYYGSFVIRGTYIIINI